MAAIPKIRGLGLTDREDRVDLIAEQIMRKDSPLMQRAAATGAAVANRRGLMNSSIAVGAAQGAVLDQVVPMASQTAQQEFQKNAAGEDYAVRKDLTQQEYGLRQGLQTNQQEYEKARDATSMNFDAQQNDLQRQAQERIAKLGLSGDAARSAQSSIDNAFGHYQESIRTIMSNDKISGPDRTAMVEAAKGLLTRQTDYVSKLQTADLQWPRFQ